MRTPYDAIIAAIEAGGLYPPARRNATRIESDRATLAYDECDARLCGLGLHPSWPPRAATRDAADGIRVWRESLAG